jgi:HEPN domain-containing protein
MQGIMARKVVDNWLSLAEYDLATAEAMLQSKRFLYVGFMCQQAVEKILKAAYVKHHALTPPYTHNVLRLVAELPWKDEIDDRRLKTLESLNSYYIESRYTEDIQELAAVLTEERTTEILRRTKELFAWIKSKL